jgi:hypothetical protein
MLRSRAALDEGGTVEAGDGESVLRTRGGVLPNKGMKLTKLSAAPTLAPQAALSRR